MALDLFGDFGIVGGADPTANPYQDAQTLINWYVEVSASKTAKMVTSLLGCPGLIQLVAVPGGGAPSSWTADDGRTVDNRSLFADGNGYWPLPSPVTDLPVRGAWVLPGYQTALVVISSVCYLVKVLQGGSSTQPGVLSLKKVGSLATDSGPVCIRDNGAGGFAILVDGANGYWYSLTDSAVIVRFTGTLTAGESTIIVQDIPNQILVGATLTDSAGYLPAGTRLTGVDFSSEALEISNAATGSSGSPTIVATVPVFGRITDSGFVGSDTIAEIDGWFIFTQPGTQTFYTNSQPYAMTFNPTYFALKDAASDRLMAVIENKEELWLIGERTTEIWYDAGGQYFPFQRLVGTLMQVGTKSPHAVCRLSQGGNDSLIWFGRSEWGENIIVRTNGFAWDVVSTPAVSNQIAQYTVTSDAQAYVYEEDGHQFYVLTFPTADRTWVYDATLPPDLAWHERLSYDPYAAQWHRHRSNCFMNLGGMRVVGDYQNGTLYQMTRAAYTDAGWPIRSVRRSPYIWDPQNRERIFMSSLQLDFRLGQGNANGLGVNPLARLRISRDYGATYGPQITAPMGPLGQTTNRCIYRKLSWSRGAVAEIEVIDPVNRDLVGATLRATGA